MTIEQRIAEMKRLSPAERLEIVEALWESLSDDAFELSDTSKAELDRRIDAPSGAVPWGEVRARLERRRATANGSDSSSGA